MENLMVTIGSAHFAPYLNLLTLFPKPKAESEQLPLPAWWKVLTLYQTKKSGT